MQKGLVLRRLWQSVATAGVRNNFHSSTSMRPASACIVPASTNIQSVRTVVYSNTGSFLERPEQVRFGVIKVLLVVIPFIFVGSMISKTGAAILEETELFVPEGDDDD
jgi:hypothetical protein